MRLVRFLYNKKIYWGVVEGGSITFLKDEPYRKIQRTAKKVSFKDITLCVPATPTKIVCAGLNYLDHARELGMKAPDEPVIFLKPASSLIAHGESICYPQGVARLDYEAELAVVIKKKAKDIKESSVHEYIFGYTCLNDVTARDLQKKDGQWTRAKSFDTFCPAGPWVETNIDASNLHISLTHKGIVKQSSTTANLIFSVPYLVSFISRAMTLFPGDIIATGTPSGIGPMKKGDTVAVRIEGIGELKNKVI